jgi:hypothetical protein
VGTDPVDVADRLSAIAEELADLALDRLRQAADSVRSGGQPDPTVTAEEKRITRARRSGEKAVRLLTPTPSEAFDGDGP